jgi:hypothetical protein
MKTSDIIIECKSYIYVAKTMLYYQYQDFFTYEVLHSHNTYLILSSDANLTHSLLIDLINNNHKNMPVSLNNNTPCNRSLCYTFKSSYLSSIETPYKHIADTILRLTYKFSYACIYTDKYGNDFILLHN